MDETARILTAMGLLLGVTGAGLIWKFGLPAKLDREGHIHLIGESVDEEEIKKAKQYDFKSGIGFALIILGFLLQAIALYL